MIDRVATVLLLCACTGHATAPPAGVVVVLGLEQSSRFAEICTREAPAADPAGFWRPEEAIVRAAELALADYVRDWSRRGLCAPLSSHVRQYLGINVEGRDLVYINSYPDGARIESDSFAIVCDGGRSFWGAVYEPDRRSVLRLDFNDDIEAPGTCW